MSCYRFRAAKSYDDVVAVDGLDFEIYEGQ